MENRAAFERGPGPRREVNMVPSPTVGIDTQPTEYNVCDFNGLRDLSDSPKNDHVAEEKCEVCKLFFDFDAGYVFLDDFYCDSCAWRLAERGEFCSGS